MQLPVDIKAVLDEALRLDEARHAPLCVSVYFDDTAPGDVQAHVRQAFASSSPTARVALTYLDGRPFAPYARDDIAVVVAGLNERVGCYASELRAAGVPTVVVTTLPALVAELAQASGYPIPEGDLVAPKAPKAGQAGGAGAGDGNEADAAAEGPDLPDLPEEPFVLDASAAATLDEALGGWVAEACYERRLAFALAFPFVRRPLAQETVNATALQNAGVGLVPILPGADLPIMTLNQAKMVVLIAAAYGEELDASRVKELACVVGGAFACRKLVRSIGANVPVVGWVVKAAVGYAGTQAMGRAAIQYYEDGATLATLQAAAGKARDKAVDLAAKAAVAKAQDVAASAAAEARRARDGASMGE